MNTPAHILISIASLTRGRSAQAGKVNQSSYLWPATIGATLPDAPMFAFYAIEKLIVGSTEREIWTTRYFLPGWQDFFDVFNSVPICLIALSIALALRRTWVVVLCVSMLLHFAFDLPLHHDDGHRHFWPLTDWRFASPVSYWDTKHFGIWAAGSEFAISVVCFVIAFRRHTNTLVRSGLVTLVAIYSLMMWGYFAYVTRVAVAGFAG